MAESGAPYAHLHVHTEYSMLDGAARLKDLFAEVTPDTIIPPWSGERLDLDYAIYTCLANEKVLKDRAAGRPIDALAASGFQPKRCGDPYCEFCFSLPLPATPDQIPVPV